MRDRSAAFRAPRGSRADEAARFAGPGRGSRIFDALGACLPQPTARAVRRGAGALLPLVRWRIPLVLLSGMPQGHTREAKLLVVGSERAARYWIGRFFAQEPRRTSLGACSLLQLSERVALWRDAADFTLVCLDEASGRWFADPGYLMVPEWIAMRAVVPQALADLAGRSKSVADDLRRVRKAAFTWRLAGDAREVDRFHARMYLPHVRARHGALLHAQSRARLLRAWRHGALILVERSGGEAVAGHLVEQEGDVLHFVAVGVRDGDPQIMRSGAAAALYAFAIEYARDRGCSRLDLRGTRPSLTDGLLRYKRKWGAGVTRKRDVLQATWMHWHDLSGAAGAFLARCAPVFAVGEALYGLVVPEAAVFETPGALQAAHDALWVPGLVALCVAGEAPSACVPDDVVLLGSGGRRRDPRAVHAALRTRGAT